MDEMCLTRAVLRGQVSSRTASSGAQAAAGKLGAQLALELVGYDPELKAAMAYVFGNAFVCKVRRRPPRTEPSFHPLARCR